MVASYAGELRVQLFKKNESIMGGKAVVANAGIYVKNIVSHINQHGGIDKEFTLFTKDGKSAGGSVHLRIDFVPVDGATMVRQQSQSASAKEGLGVHNFTEDEAATKLQASFRGHMVRAGGGPDHAPFAHAPGPQWHLPPPAAFTRFDAVSSLSRHHQKM